MSPAAPSPVRLGVAGCARILPAHLRGLHALRSAGLDVCHLTALCARTIDDAARFRLRGEGPPPRPPASDNPRDPLGAPHLYASDVQPEPLPELFDDWRRMVESDAVDAVLILAPVQLHHQIALAALAAGKHVLIEKPFAITVRAGLAIAGEAKRRGLVAGVAENNRYAEAGRALGWVVVSQGLIGTPQLWLSGGIGGEWAPDRIVAHTPWRHRKLEGGGGPAIDGAVHLMHQIRYVMGPVEEVCGMARTLEPERVERDAAGRVVGRVTNELEDFYAAHLRFAGGAAGSVFGGWAGRGEGTSLDGSPVVYGSDGCVKGSCVIRDGSRERAVELLERDGTTELKERFFPRGVRDAFGLELLDFCRAIQLGTPMEDSADEGVMDLAVAYAVLESAVAGRPVRVEEVMRGAANVYQAEIDEHYGI